MSQEEQVACAEEVLIISTPITGIGNSLRFDYRIDITQAQHGLHPAQLRRRALRRFLAARLGGCRNRGASSNDPCGVAAGECRGVGEARPAQTTASRLTVITCG